MQYPQIEPFISPSELKGLIDAGQNWVPISKAEWAPFMTCASATHGYALVQKVGWIQGEEPSPLDLGLPCGVILMPCTGQLVANKKEEESSETTYYTRFDPCFSNWTWYGLLTDKCARHSSSFEKIAKENDHHAECSVTKNYDTFQKCFAEAVANLFCQIEERQIKKESEDNEPTS